MCCGSPSSDTYYLPLGTNFDTAPLSNTLYSDASQTIATPGIYKGVNGQYRQLDAQGVLGALTSCPTCPPVVACSDSGFNPPSGTRGYYNVDLNVGSDIGAVQIFFIPDTKPDGVRSIYNGQVYNTIVDPRMSRTQVFNGQVYTVDGGIYTDTTGGFVFCGSSSDPCADTIRYNVLYDPIQSYPYYDGFQGGSWLLSPQSPEEYTFNVKNLPGGTTTSWNNPGGRYWNFGVNTWNSIVIPKTSAFIQTVQLQVLGPCADTRWDSFALCPQALPSFQASVKQTSSVCAAATQTYYFTPLPPFITSAGDIIREYERGPDLPSFPITYTVSQNPYSYGYRQVFKDPNGVTPMDDGWYASGTGKTIQVENGIVVAYINCT